MNINIKDLTIGQVEELSKYFTLNHAKTTLNKFPIEIGKSYLFRTVTHIEVGRVKSVCGDFVTLTDASWIPDTGRYHECLANGKFSEVEPYPDTTTINMASLINFAPWNHELPKEQL